MKSVFILTKEESVCFGHGDYATLNRVAYEGYGNFYPVFLTKEDANKYITEKNIFGVKPTEFSIYQ